MGQSGRTSRVGAGAALALPLLAALVLAGLLVVDQRQRAGLRADASLRAAVASAASEAAVTIQGQLSPAAAETAEGGRTVTAAQATATGSGLAALIEARDSGMPVLDDAGGHASVVVPVYRPGLPVLSTEDRRAGISAYRLVPLSLRGLVQDAAPARGGLAVRGPQGDAVAQSGRRPGSARVFAVDLDLTDAPGWRLEGWVRNPGTPGSAWLWVVALLAVAAFASAAARVRRRQRLVLVARSLRLERDRELVTGLAPIVQGSLDLAQVVPAVSTQLAEGLDLLGVGLAVPGESGERQLFTWGRTPDATVLPMGVMPSVVPTGETLAVSLKRDGRVLGVLRIVAGEPLHEPDLQALGTASELLGATLANAEAFARQQVLVERMQSVDELKTIFLATASHELRTPVTAIVGFSQLLLQQWDDLAPATGREFLERVMANAKGLDSLIEQLLDFSRLDRGMSPVANELLDLAATTRLILDDQPDLYSGHELSCDLVPGADLWGSRAALERIVSNLVGNAAKYSPPGTTISVSVRAESGHVTLVVDDEGDGVPQADRERVFSRFFRGTGDAVTGTRGAGIGLAIVAEYAAAMNGSALVSEAPSGGARFSVTFPAAVPDLDVLTEGAQHVALP